MRGFLLRIPQGIEIQTYSTQKTGPQKRMYETLTEREKKSTLLLSVRFKQTWGIPTRIFWMSIFSSKRSKQKVLITSPNQN